MNRIEDKRNVFNLIFKDNNYEDWYITLHTTELKTEEEIMSLINYYSEINDKNYIGYSPVDIMDDLCEDNEGWYWTDMEYVEINAW